MPDRRDMPTSEDLRSALLTAFREATRAGRSHLDVNSGDLHERLGGYPSPANAMPSCCNVMWQLKGPRDTVRHSPPKGRGARLTIRYAIPR